MLNLANAYFMSPHPTCRKGSIDLFGVAKEEEKTAMWELGRSRETELPRAAEGGGFLESQGTP